MRRLFVTTICALSVLWGLPDCARANFIELVPAIDLPGTGVYTPASAFLETTMNSGNLHAEVHSQAFTDGDKYVYLYQVFNTGTTGNSSVEKFTLGQFAGSIIQEGDIGYLTGTPPTTDFLSGGQTPMDQGQVTSVAGGLDISFSYWIHQIAPITSENSSVMFIVSGLSPGLVTGNVIDGNVGTGQVIGAVPEPAVLGLLLSGGLAVLAYSLHRRQRHG